jgi:hypothetical protein
MDVIKKILAKLGAPAARMVAAALMALAALAFTGGGGVAPRAAAATRGPQQMAGTWDVTWLNSSGEARKGQIVISQRGSQLSARIVSQGNVTATGSIAGSSFTLRGTRLGVPFTVTGRVDGRRMSGALTALLIERRFVGTRRRGR